MQKARIIGIDTKRCKGCGICVEFCPKQVLCLNSIPKAAIANRDACIGCRVCERRCPDFALIFEEET